MSPTITTQSNFCTSGTNRVVFSFTGHAPVWYTAHKTFRTIVVLKHSCLHVHFSHFCALPRALIGCFYFFHLSAVESSASSCRIHKTLPFKSVASLPQAAHYPKVLFNLIKPSKAQCFCPSGLLRRTVLKRLTSDVLLTRSVLRSLHTYTVWFSDK